MKEAGPQKKVTGVFLRGSTFAARTVDGILRQLPRLFELAANDVEKPGSVQQRKQVLLIARPPRKEKSARVGFAPPGHAVAVRHDQGRAECDEQFEFGFVPFGRFGKI